MIRTLWGQKEREKLVGKSLHYCFQKGVLIRQVCRPRSGQFEECLSVLDCLQVDSSLISMKEGSGTLAF